MWMVWPEDIKIVGTQLTLYLAAVSTDCSILSVLGSDDVMIHTSLPVVFTHSCVTKDTSNSLSRMIENGQKTAAWA